MPNHRSSPIGVRVATSALAAAASLLACAELPPQRAPSPSKALGVLITRDDIERSGARDAWEAIRKNVNHLRFSENANGDPSWVGANRGSLDIRSSDEQILLVLDGVLMISPVYLRRIPAETVAYIQILSGSQGTARYGLSAGNGVVVVRTVSPQRGVTADGT